MFGTGFHPRISVLAHEPHQACLPFDAVLDCARKVSAGRVWTKYHQQIGKAFGQLTKIGARPVGPDILESNAASGAKVDAAPVTAS